ncbi:MAG: AAA family ATPase [Planctomycetota bacterium]|nr:AAA family ATPase [Planctomycetota bacterium]
MTTVRTVDAQRAGVSIRDSLQRVVALDDDVMEPLLVALFAGGHVLIEGIPGTGKTLLARTLAKATGLGFNRIQFTNDLMPADILGTSMWRPGEGVFEFVPGPIFSQIVLADEVNRTSPRTLSCLLEAMESGTVSAEGRAFPLPDPFFVIATRNPIEFHGTFPIPEAALDRFLVRVAVDYPTPDAELGLYLGRDPEAVFEEVAPALDHGALLMLMEQVPEVTVQEPVARYAYQVVAATREHEGVVLGASPRAALAWLRAARARALLDGRDYVVPDDLKRLAGCVLSHRVFLTGGGDARTLVQDLVASTPVEL